MSLAISDHTMLPATRHKCTHLALTPAGLAKLLTNTVRSNLTPSVDAYLLGEQFCRFHPDPIWNDGALTTRTRWVATCDQFLIQKENNTRDIYCIEIVCTMLLWCYCMCRC